MQFMKSLILIDNMYNYFLLFKYLHKIMFKRLLKLANVFKFNILDFRDRK